MNFLQSPRKFRKSSSQPILQKHAQNSTENFHSKKLNSSRNEISLSKKSSSKNSVKFLKSPRKNFEKFESSQPIRKKNEESSVEDLYSEYLNSSRSEISLPKKSSSKKSVKLFKSPRNIFEKFKSSSQPILEKNVENSPEDLYSKYLKAHQNKSHKNFSKSQPIKIPKEYNITTKHLRRTIQKEKLEKLRKKRKEIEDEKEKVSSGMGLKIKIYIFCLIIFFQSNIVFIRRFG